MARGSAAACWVLFSFFCFKWFCLGEAGFTPVPVNFFSPAGETIEIGCAPMDSKRIQFFVKDKGPGIPPEFREAVFDKFMQVSSRKDGRKFTTGLGLTFCKMAVEEHKGKIYAESDEGQGSRFVFFLPIG